jgi:hypothetical protein
MNVNRFIVLSLPKEKPEPLDIQEWLQAWLKANGPDRILGFRDLDAEQSAAINKTVDQYYNII